LDIYTIDINEQHYNFKDSKFYIFGNIDIYKSDVKVGKTETSINSTLYDLLGIKIDLSSTLNQIFDNSLPISSRYKVNGLDGDIGVGYDIFQKENYYVGMGITYGMAFPFLSDKSTIQLFTKETNSEVNTYKFGVSLQGGYTFTQNISIYTTAIYAYQFGDTQNPLLGSTLDMKGIYSFIDLGIKVKPNKDSSLSKFYSTLGFTAKNWIVDDIEFSIAGIESGNLAPILKNSLSSNYFYLGVGYDF